MVFLSGVSDDTVDDVFGIAFPFFLARLFFVWFGFEFAGDAFSE